MTIGMSRRGNDLTMEKWLVESQWLFCIHKNTLFSVYNAWIKQSTWSLLWAGNKTKANKNSSAHVIHWKTQNHFSTLLSTISQVTNFSQSYSTVLKKFAINS